MSDDLTPTCSESPPTGWHAQLSLGFEKTQTETVLAQRRHSGPLLVQKPFYPEGSVCHVYLIHPPGGVVGGDRIDLDVRCPPQTDALITTPAAGKFYRSDGRIAQQNIHLKVADGATLEWLPQETIIFDGAQVSSKTQVELFGSARFIGCETIIMGRPACSERFKQGQLRTRFEIRKDNQPLLLEQMLLDQHMIGSVCGLQNHSLVAILLIFPATQQELQLARDIAGEQRWFGATLVDGLLICRLLDHQAEPVHHIFRAIWAAVRPIVLGRIACPPRIWAT